MLEFQEIERFDDLERELIDRFGEIPQQAGSAVNYFRLRLLIEKIGLESLKMKKDSIIVEFNSIRMPSRSKLADFVGTFKYPFKIDATKNLKLIFQVKVPKAAKQNFILNETLKMAEYLNKNL